MRIAASPATWGVAIEVPDRVVYHASTGSPSDVPRARAATMPTPGATTSGFVPPSPSRGPRPENEAAWSSPSTAPTVRAASAAPGALSDPGSGPAFPAATTNSVFELAERSSIARLRGSLPSLGSPPRLMLTTSAPFATAHCIPARTAESSPVPVWSRTLPIISRAPGATPPWTPGSAAPVPAIVEATWVP